MKRSEVAQSDAQFSRIKLARPGNWARLAMVRIAWLTLGKTSEELKEILMRLEASDIDIFGDLSDGIPFFKRYAEMMEAAQVRLLVAGSAMLAGGKLAA